MGTTKQDQERVRALLKEAITVLCKNGLQYRAKFSIEGLLGITLDDDEVFLVSIHEQVGEEVSKILQQKELPPPASPLSRTAGSSGGSQPSHSAPASPRTPGSKKTQSKKSTVLPVTVNLDQEESDNSRDSMGQSVLDSTPSGHSQPLPGSMASPSRQSSSNMEHNQRKRPRDSTASPNGDDQHQNFGSLQLSVDDIPGEGAARSGDDADTGTRLQSEDSEHSAKRRALDSSHTQSSADSDILSNIEVKQEIEEDEEDLIFVKEEGNQNPPSCQLAMSQSSSSEMMLGGVPQFSDSDQPGPSHWDPLQGPPQNLHGAQLGSSPAQDSQVQRNWTTPVGSSWYQTDPGPGGHWYTMEGELGPEFQDNTIIEEAGQLTSESLPTGAVPTPVYVTAKENVNVAGLLGPDQNPSPQRAVVPPTCPHCQKQFCDKGNLKRHINSIHFQTNWFKCQFCEVKKSRKDHLLSHLRLFHKYDPLTGHVRFPNRVAPTQNKDDTTDAT